MSELARVEVTKSGVEDAVDKTPALYAVPDITIVPAVEDARGRVITPAIDVSTKRMPNGQKIESFYDRGDGRRQASSQALSALGRATRMLRR